MLMNELLQQANQALQDTWKYVRKPCPVLTINDFKEAAEPSGVNWNLSNHGKALKLVCRDGKSYNGILIASIQYQARKDVNQSRSLGVFFNFKHYILIAIDTVEGTVSSTRYHVTNE